VGVTNETPETIDSLPKRTEEFLLAVEKKTTNEIQLRLLQAARKGNPTASIEDELRRIIEEIIP
jgi:hypothetical protein